MRRYRQECGKRSLKSWQNILNGMRLIPDGQKRKSGLKQLERNVDMNQDLKDKITRLKELIAGIRIGDWIVSNFNPNLVITGDGSFYAGIQSESNNTFSAVNKRTAEYIASANPATILELIAEIEALEKEVDWLAAQRACQHIKDGCQCGIDKEYRREEARKAVREGE